MTCRRSGRARTFSVAPTPTAELWFDHDGEALGFLTVTTVFAQPGPASVEELRVESWFPLDDATAAACRRLAG